MTNMKFLMVMLAVFAVLALPQSVVAQRQPDLGGDLFNRLDKNGDGVLTSDDLSKERQQLFNRLVQRGDKNKDGKLTRDEFTAALRDRGGRAKAEESVRGRSGGRRQGRGGPRGGSFGASAPDVGDALPDVTVYDAEGQEFKLSSMRDCYSVIVFGCLT